MNEKTIIQGVVGKKNLLARILLITGITLLIVAIATIATEYQNGYSIDYYIFFGEPRSDMRYHTEKYGSLFSYFISYILWETGDQMISFFILCGAVATLISYGISLLAMNRCSLTVTDRRVVGKGSWGKAVDLPLNQISSIGLGLFKKISISTSSGNVSFWLVENREEVHEKLSELMAQSNNVTQNVEASSADELKKYKDLLDSGVITAEEFEAKKKQLLGL